MTFDSRLLNGIEVLAAVAEAGSFVRAAESLGLTQSGVSRAIARLETRVGVRMFDRTARRRADRGRAKLLSTGQAALSSIEDAAIQAAGSAAAVRGRLRVNVEFLFRPPCARPARRQIPGGTSAAVARDLGAGPARRPRGRWLRRCSAVRRAGTIFPRRPAVARDKGADLRRSSLSGPARSPRPPARTWSWTARMHSLRRPRHRPPVPLGVPSRAAENPGRRFRTPDREQCRNHAWRLRRRSRHCPDPGASSLSDSGFGRAILAR